MEIAVVIVVVAAIAFVVYSGKKKKPENTGETQKASPEKAAQNTEATSASTVSTEANDKQQEVLNALLGKWAKRSGQDWVEYTFFEDATYSYADSAGKQVDHSKLIISMFGDTINMPANSPEYCRFRIKGNVLEIKQKAVWASYKKEE